MSSGTIEDVNNMFQNKNKVSITAELPEDVQTVLLEMFEQGTISGYITSSLEGYYGALITVGVSACFPEELRNQIRKKNCNK